MAIIDIRRQHGRTLQEAKADATEMAHALEQRFDLKSSWHGDRLSFSRSGLDGHIDVDENELHLTVKLGFFLAALRGTIEQHIKEQLDQRMGPQA